MALAKTLLILVGLLALVGVSVLGTLIVIASMIRPHFTVNNSSTTIYDSFVHWKNTNQKKYGKGEEALRFAVYANNHQKVAQHNSNPSALHTQKLNQFADISTQEFKARYLTLTPQVGTNVKNLIGSVADSVDWRTKNVVTDVKDQGQCGSCWAFSATGSLESAYALKNGKQELFSEQQLVDCSTSYGNQGCNGGLMDQAFNYVIASGITTESAYPYRAVDQSCKTKGGAFKISSFVDVPASDADQLAVAVNIQPVSVAVDAENW
jgi:C1A family cysteine protease